MKVIKDKTLSLLPRPVNIQGRQHLVLGVLVFFDLTAPDTLLDEQELWKTIPAQLGPAPILDQGMPKQQGEFLVMGEGCAPRGQELQSLEVSVSLGDREKRLLVFGDRFWGHEDTITDPKKFTRIPLTWENAFGGPSLKTNPVGKGLANVLKDGESVVPLPNVENPKKLIELPKDRPEPEGFAPLDITWPQRNMQSGTFDERWKTERWPGLPDDFDYSFFNAAPMDQRLNGFFAGNEEIVIRNMHPDYTTIASRLPPYRVRCFVTLREHFKRFEDPNQFKQVFQEVTLHPETIWLFPSILRGICIWRGTVEVADEDYGDVVRVFLGTEDMDVAPGTLEHWRAAEAKALDRAVPIDMAPLEAAKGKISEAMLTMKNVPKEIAQIKKTALGQAPVMPRTAAELGEQSKNILRARMNTLDKLENLARGMNERWGHHARVNLEPLSKVRGKLQALEAKVDTSVGKLQAMRKKAEAKKSELIEKNSKFLKENLTPEQLKKTGMDPDKLWKGESVNPWHDHAFPFVVQCRRNLEHDQELRSALTRMGLKRKTWQRAWLGVNYEETSDDAASWGLAKGETPQPRLTLPAGLVLPRFDGPVCNRVLIRRPDEDGSYIVGQQEHLVTASDTTPLFLPPADPGDEEHPAPVVIVADELQALLVEQEAGDACGVLTMRSPDVPPDPEGADALKNAHAVLVIMPENTSEDGVAWSPWHKAMPTAILLPLPKGRTVFESRAAGTDIRKTIMDALPKEFAKKHALSPELPEKGKPPANNLGMKLVFPALNVSSLVAELSQGIKALHQPRIDAVRANKGNMLAKLREQFGDQGLDPEKSLADAAAKPRQSYVEMGDKLAEQMLQKRDAYKAMGAISDEKAQEITAQAAKVREIAAMSQARAERQKATFAAKNDQANAMKAQALAKKLPGPAGESMEKAGLTPDALAPLTREQVVERYQAGLDFQRKNLTGLDLSELELPGIDLRKAILEKTRFNKSNLKGALFENAYIKDVDFTQAALGQARFQGCLLQGVKLVKANCGEANFKRCMIKDADCTKADFSGASMRLLHLNKAVLKEADLADSDCSLSIFMGCDIGKSLFLNAKLRKVIFRDCNCDDANFSGAELPQSAFQGSKGERVTFAGANLDRARIISQSAFPGVDMQKTTLRGACFRESDLSDSSFSNATLDNVLMEGCVLHRANLERISAKKARITKCDLEAATLRATNMAQGSLRMSRLVETDCNGANLFGVDFYKVTVGKTNFRLANLKRTILFNRTDLLR